MSNIEVCIGRFNCVALQSGVCEGHCMHCIKGALEQDNATGLKFTLVI